MGTTVYIANKYRKHSDINLIKRVRNIIQNEPIMLKYLSNYPYQISCDNCIYPVEIDKMSVSLHIYSTQHYIQFWQSLKRIVENNLDLFGGFSFSRQNCKIYLWLNKPYREL